MVGTIVLDKKYNNKELLPSDVAKYLLARALDDGELVSPLKMQKLVYYAYVWFLIERKKKLFNEEIEAWPMGPVVASLYQELKHYGSAPIGEDYLGSNKESAIKQLLEKTNGAREILDKVYEKYDSLTAFELVRLTHNEKPWLIAREGLGPDDPSLHAIADQDILEYYKGQSL